MFHLDVYTKVLEKIKPGARLVAVSKTVDHNSIMEAYSAGQRIFGENRVQELVPKAEALPKDMEWHLIGHLQRNKVKYIAPFVHMIQSVDSMELLMEIEKQAAKYERKISVLLQFHIASEDSKFGLNPNAWDSLKSLNIWQEIPHVKVCGLMGMATFTEDENQIRSEFQSLKNLFDRIKEDRIFPEADFCEISMGMSSDYAIALEEGATLIRIGSALFGSRG